MQNEEPRTKRTAAGIESRNVLYIYIYLCVYIYIYRHLLRIRISTVSLLPSSETGGVF